MSVKGTSDFWLLNHINKLDFKHDHTREASLIALLLFFFFFNN